MVEIDKIKLTQIKKAEYNPRTISEENYAKLKNSVKNFGLVEPILINLKNNTIISGHQRYDVLTDLILTDGNLAEKEFHLLKYGDLGLILDTDEPTLENEDYEKALNITLNNTNLTGEYNFEKLSSLLEDLEINDFDLELTGFNGLEDIDFDFDGFDWEQEETTFTDKDYEELEDNYETEEVLEVTVQDGDLYKLGNHRLMCGDSTNKKNVEALINKQRIDMVFTDPPYGINLNGDNSKRGGETSLMKGGLKLKSFKDDSITYAIQAWDIIQEIGVKVQVWFGANYYCHHLPQTNNWLIWDKRVEEKMTNTNSDCELAWVLDGHNSCRIFRHLWNGLIKASENNQKRVHPTQKPIALSSWCIERYNPSGETVLDLFGGSGSTLIACEQLNRKCYIMELDPYYCQVIINRWEEYTGEKAEKIN